MSYVIKLVVGVLTSVFDKYLLDFFHYFLRLAKQKKFEKVNEKKLEEVTAATDAAKKEIKEDGTISEVTRQNLIDKTRDLVRGSFGKH